MENPNTRGKRIGRIAMAIGFACVIGGVGVGPALAGGGGHDRGDRGHPQPRHEERHDNYRYETAPNYYYAPAPPPNYYYAPPPPVYYEPPPVYYGAPARSEGWTFIFP
jgi:hypothetical protein